MISNATQLGINSRSRLFDGGRGTIDRPYRIAKPRHLNNMKKYPSAHYVLINDIVFTDEFEEDGEYYNGGALWAPISTFSGTIDGQGYKIQNLKSIFSTSYRGAFANYTSGNASIKNIYFKNIYVDRTSSNIQHTGTVVSQGTSTLLIEGVYVDGYFRTGLRSGGILGSFGKLKRCATNLNHIASDVSGGLVYNTNFVYVEDCYTRGSISGTPYHVGGISGTTYGARLLRCYSAEHIVNGSYKRGLISYYDSANPNGESYDCFWDINTTTATTTVNNGPGLTVGLTTAQSKYLYPTYNGTDQAYSMWDFDTIWAHDTDGTINDGYPYLRGVTPVEDQGNEYYFDYRFDFNLF